MRKEKLESLSRENEAKWDNYFGADAIERGFREGEQDAKEVFFKVSAEELSNLDVIGDRVLVQIDELVEMTVNGLSLVLSEDFGNDQHNTKHQSVSGIVICGDLPKGIRAFFHYNSIVAAKTRLAKAGIFIECEGKAYALLPKKVFYVGIIDGKPVSLHPDFCITESIPNEVTDMEREMGAKDYEPFKCKIVSLPETFNEKSLLRISDTTIETRKITSLKLEVGQIVKCRKAWDLPLDNGLQDFLDGKQYFRTRIAAIKEIIE